MANKNGKGVIELVPHDDFCDGDKNCTCSRGKTVLAIRKRITKVLDKYVLGDPAMVRVAINEIMRGDPEPKGLQCQKCPHTGEWHNG